MEYTANALRLFFDGNLREAEVGRFVIRRHVDYDSVIIRSKRLDLRDFVPIYGGCHRFGLNMKARKILVPQNLTGDIQIADVHVALHQRVRRDEILVTLRAGDLDIQVRSPSDGWVKFVAVKSNQVVGIGDLLMILSVFDVGEYRLDDQEVSLLTELGEDGRRGLEREGQKQYTDGYDKALFDAPTDEHGQRTGDLKVNPLTERMKEGVPPKMNANAANNGPAKQHTVEQASGDPAYAEKLSAQLQQELDIAPGDAPSSAPTFTRG